MGGRASYDPFSTFLAGTSRGAGGAGASTTGMALDVLNRLARDHGPLEEVRLELGLTALQLARALVELQDQGLVVVPEDDPEAVTLSDVARRLLAGG